MSDFLPFLKWGMELVKGPMDKIALNLSRPFSKFLSKFKAIGPAVIMILINMHIKRQFLAIFGRGKGNGEKHYKKVQTNCWSSFINDHLSSPEKSKLLLKF